MYKLFVLLGFSILFAACSNPFSSQKPVALKENANPKNTSCTEVRFDESELSIKQLRSMIHCLNQSDELKEIEDWSLTVSDEEYKPLINRFNETLNQEPELLYALKEIYLEYSKNGELNKIISQLLKNLQTPEQRNLLVGLIQNHSSWLNNFLSHKKYKINLEKLSLISDVNSFNRVIDEQFHSQNLPQLLRAISQYHSDKNSLSFQEIFRLFSNIKPIKNKDSAEKIAGFLNWLIENNRINTLSAAAESLKSKPIKCFNNETNLSNSIEVLFQMLSKIQPEEINIFIQKKITSYMLIGNGYCNIPIEVMDAAKIILDASQEENLSSFFSLIQPLLLDQSFINLFASTGFRNLINDVNKNKNNHLFQDLISLTDWLKNNPVIEKNSAELMDSIFDEFQYSEINNAINLLPDDASFYKSLQKAYDTIPGLRKISADQKNENWMSPFSKRSFTPVIELISRMNSEKKISLILDRAVDLFKAQLEKGKNEFKKTLPIKPRHSKVSNSQEWKLNYWNSTSNYLPSSCIDIPLSYHFFNPSPTELPTEYISKIENLSSCFNVNRSFVGLKDLLFYLSSQKNKFNGFNSLQSDALAFIFSLNSNQTFNTIENIIKLKPDDLSSLKDFSKSISSLLAKSKSHLKSSVELRKLTSNFLSKEETFKALSTQFQPTILQNSNNQNLLKEKLFSVTMQSLPNLFNEFCESLNTQSPECDIESDQVYLYISNPEKLARSIVDEYITSSTSWAHPLEFSNWKFQKNSTPDVSNFNFHLNPLLEQFTANKNSFNSVFGFIKRNEKSSYPLISFLNEKSNQYQLIPYIFKKPTYPNATQEFSQHIRLRLVSDLDRLELLAINSDFQAFGMVKNFGMSFITEIARSWGNVSVNERPKLGTDKTISEAKKSILQQFKKFNLGLLQRLGSCDPRGLGKLRNAMNEYLCRGEVGDIRARMFNLKYMISILDDEEGLKLLRDLFYSIYENNYENQFGVYSNGVKNEFNSNVDLLEMIPKIAHLGLLHHTSLSLSNTQSNVAESMIQLLKSFLNHKKSNQLSEFVVSDSGKNFIKSSLHLGLELNSNESNQLSNWINTISKIDHLEWMSFLINLLIKYPNVLQDYAPTAHSLLNRSSPSTFTPEMMELISNFSKNLNNPKLIEEVYELLIDFSKSQNEIQSLINTNLSNIITNEWVFELSKHDHQKHRTQISNFLKGDHFDLFCDVFSDATLMAKTYNFLESSHQNSDVLELLQDSRRFFH